MDISNSFPFYSNLIKYQINRAVVVFSFFLLSVPSLAQASYIPFNTNVAGNIAIGTSTPQGKFVVLGGNVGIGTWAPANTFQVGINNFLLTSNGNVGVGSSWPGELVDVQGTVRALSFIGNGAQLTNLPAGGAAGSPNQVQYNNAGNLAGANNFVFTGSNVGIGSAAPGQILDITGTVRTMFLTMSGQTPVSGYVLTASDSAGDATWTSTSAVSGWTVSGNNVYETLGGNVGIGTTLLTTSALTVMNGNVGIGTWLPAALLQVAGNARIDNTLIITNTANILNDGSGNLAIRPSNNTFKIQDTTGTLNYFTVLSGGNVGIGTPTPVSKLAVVGNIGIGTGINSSFVTTTAPNGGMIVQGNVGIGSLTPGQILDVTGTVRTMFFTMSGQTPVGGYVLTASDSAGDATWTSTSAVSGWTVTGNNVYETLSGNVGIGTTAVNQGALVVTNGNVGIGTWTPAGLLEVNGTLQNFYVAGNGNVGIGTAVPRQALEVNGSIISSSLLLNNSTAVNFSGTKLQFAAGAAWTQASIFTNSIERMRIDSNGNVGIGTSSPFSLFNVAGGVGIGTGMNSPYLTTAAPSGGMIVQGNVGLGSLAPGQALDVTGTVRTMFFTMSGQTPVSGYVLTASDSVGDATWTSTSAVSGWTVTGNNVYETLGGNVGIGTTLLTTSALTVMNGNVGIGTWLPSSILDVNGTLSIGPGPSEQTFKSDGSGASLRITSPHAVIVRSSQVSGEMSVTAGGADAEASSIFNLIGTNVGIGTWTNPLGKLIVTGGNVGIGTFNPYGGQLIVASGNVGIGSLAPGQALDVTGTVRTMFFTMSGQTPVSGYVLTASDSVGDATWTSTSAVSGWTVSGNNVYETLSGNVGIGTTLLTTSALTVMNGNVGIGTWAPGQLLDVLGSARMTGFILNNSPVSGDILMTNGVGLGTWIAASAVSTPTPPGGVGTELQYRNGANFAAVTNSAVNPGGNVGLGTILSANKLDINGGVGIGTAYAGYVTAPPNGLIVQGNVGIGSTAPGQKLDVTGTVRTQFFTMSGQTPVSGYVLTASDSAGDTTWSSAGAVSGWTVSGNNVYETLGGNVGIGTTLVTTAALTVMNGNVGIGTWTPFAPLQIVGIGTTIQQGTLVVTNGNVGIGTWLTSPAEITVTEPQNTLSNPSYLMQQWTTNNNFNTTFNVGVDAYGGFMVGSHGGSPGFFTREPYMGVDGVAVVYNARSANFGGTGSVYDSTDFASAFVQNNGNFTFETAPSGAAGSFSTFSPVVTIQNGGNVGIGTTLPSSLLEVGNQKFNVLSNGNVGIGSITPGQALDIQGTARMTGFDLTNNGASNGYVMVTNSVGIGTWMPSNTLPIAGSATPGGTPSQLQYNSGGTLGGIVNSNVNASGNVGLGTILSANKLDINGGVGIGTAYAGYVSAPPNGLIVQGNVGIGSTAPGQKFDVQGTVRTTGFTMSGQTPVSGYVLTASDSAGDTTWSSAGAVSGWTVSGNNVYETAGGNVGIGTTLLTTSALTVMNGNVGIGTWIPGNSLEVVGGNIGISPAYNLIGIGTTSTILTLRNDTTSIYVGWRAGAAASGAGLNNAALGEQALEHNSSGALNTAVGFRALAANTTGGDNTAVGEASLLNNTTGLGNTAVGLWTLFNSTGSNDTAVGYWALLNNLTGQNNTAVGFQAGAPLGTGGTLAGSNNVFLGTNSGPIAGEDWSNSVGIGSFAVTGASNVMVLGGTGVNALNVGIGTFSPVSTLAISGNAAIGSSSAYTTTIAPPNGLIVQGNVGIGSLVPGQALDVNGTVRTMFFTMSGQTPTSGYVLTASDSAGDATWASASAVGGWTVTGNNVYETAGGNVGIGTTLLTTSALTVMNGNVGIGTWVPGQLLDVLGSARVTGFILNNSPVAGDILMTNGVGLGTWIAASAVSTPTPPGGVGTELQYRNGANFAAVTNSAVNPSGNVGLGTILSANKLDINGGVGIGTAYAGYVAAPPNGLIVQGNVGIGSTAPGQKLDINGTVRTTGFTMSGQTPISGYVLTASDSAGDTTWTSPGSVSGWTVSGNNVYETLGGNVGIGTTLVTTSALTVMNGNVGIGTWLPASQLDVHGSTSTDVFDLYQGGTKEVWVNQFGNLNVVGSIQDANIIQVGNSFGGVVPILQVNGLPSHSYLQEWGNNNTGSYYSAVNGSGNLGIGTFNPIANQLVVNGAIGIGTANSSFVATTAPSGGMIVQGNVGIGSLTPGQALDVFGTVRTTGFTMSGQTPVSGYVLTASDSAGDTTWTSPGSVSGWTVSGNNVYETLQGNVGIGTTIVNQAALTVMNGNVGIGTWNPQQGSLTIFNNSSANSIETSHNGISILAGANNQSLYMGYDATLNAGYIEASQTGVGEPLLLQPRAVGGQNVGIGTLTPKSRLAIVGNVGIGTGINSFYVSTPAPAGGMIIEGNVGLGSLAPGMQLDIQGTARMTGFDLTNNGAANGYVMVTNAVGLGTWMPSNTLPIAGSATPGGVSPQLQFNNGGALSGIANGGSNGTNIGIGTVSFTNSLNILGNIGIGTVSYSKFITTSAPNGGMIVEGNMGIGSTAPGESLDVNGTVRITGLNALNFGNDNKVSLVPSGTTTPDLRFLTNSSEVMRITNGGNIGIGTVTPVNALELRSGNLHMAGNSIFFRGTIVGQATDQNDFIHIDSATQSFIQIAGFAGVNLGYTSSGFSTTMSVVGPNVGIGSLTPGQALDVTGTVRTQFFAMSGQTPISGYVLTASDSAGDTTWTSPGSVSGWTVSGNNVYETLSGNVGIGTTTVNQGALVVTNGNVGIGTWSPRAQLDVEGTLSIVSFAGNVGIGSTAPENSLVVNGHIDLGNGGELHKALYFNGTNWVHLNTGLAGFVIKAVPGNILFGTSAAGTVGTVATLINAMTFTGANGNVGIGIGTLSASSQLSIAGNVGIGTNASSAYAITNAAPPGGMIVEGNVGIGSLTPGQQLDIQGTARMTGFDLTNNGAANGYVMVTNSVGIGTWMPSNTLPIAGSATPGGVSPQLQYNSGGSLAGIASGGSNGTNIGIGTVSFVNTLNILGNVGVGTISYSKYLTTPAPSGGAIFEGNVGIGSINPAGLLDVEGGNTLGITASGIILAAQNTSSGGGLGGSVTITAGFTGGGSAGDVSITAGEGQGGGNAGNVVLTAGSSAGAFNPGGNASLTGGASVGANAPGGNVTVAGGAGWSGGNVSITAGTGSTTGNGIINLSGGNVGIGSSHPGQSFDVQGTVRTTGFTMSGQTPISGYVLTASDSAGDTTWTSPGSVSGWTVSGNNVYETLSGNVGIGTTLLTTSALTVMNGNVGIGTWIPGNSLEVAGGNIGIGTAYNLIGIGTTSTILTLRNDTSSVYLGWQAGPSTTRGSMENTAVGTQSLNLDTTGVWNTAMGFDTLFHNTTGFGNSAVGTSTLLQNTTGQSNSAMGFQALEFNTTGSFNSVLGFEALLNNGSGQNNTAVGYQAGNPLGVHGTVNGANNVFIGANSGPIGLGDYSNSVGIGSFALTGANNVMVLGGMGVNALNVGIGTFSPVSTLAVSGNEAIGSGGAYTTTTAPPNGLIVQGNVGIGSLSPGQALDVNGTVRQTGFILSNNGANNGYVMVTNAVGLGTWMPSNTLPIAGSATPGGVTPQLQFNNGGALSGIGNGGSNGTNIGIGTVSFVNTLNILGNIGIGTISYSKFLTTTAPSGGMIVEGNVGIGSANPSYSLDILTSATTRGLNVNDNGVGATAIYGNSSAVTGAGYGVYGTSASTSTGAVGVYGYQSAGSGQVTGVFGQTVSSNGGSAGVAGLAAAGYGVQGSSNTGYSGYFLSSGAGNTAATLVVEQNGASTAHLVEIQNSVNAAMTVVSSTGNVGIGSTAPGQALDVNGTIRTTGFTMSGQTPISGYVLTASDSAGDTTWTSPGSVSGWTVSGNNVYETLGGNVGIGTTIVNQAALTVMNGNVGIGTWSPQGALIVQSGNVGIGTLVPGVTLDVNGAIRSTTAGGNSTFAGNVGIGTPTPGQPLDVNGIARMTGFELTGNGAATGNVMVTNAVGIGTWMAVSSLGAGGTPANPVNSVQYNNSGSFGGSSNFVFNGTNVGIGTWVPGTLLQVGNTTTPAIFASGNQVSIGTNTTGYTLEVYGSNFYVNNTVSSNGDIYSTNAGTGFGNASTPGSTIDDFGNLAVGSTYYSDAAPTNGAIIQGNVGIGSTNPGQILDVQGTVRTTAFAMSGQTPISGYVLTASDSAGDTTWTSPGAVSGWTVSGNNVYETGNGNVGIGTWAPASGLQLNQSFAVYRTGGAGTVASSGQTIIGVNSGAPHTITLSAADTVNGRIIIIKDETGSAGTNNITVQPASGTIDGSASVVISANYGVVRVYSDGTNWFTF